MDTYSIGDVAAELGTSRPRLQRAIDDLDIQPVNQGRGRRLSNRERLLIRQHLGSTPTVDGLTREDLFILRALSLRPFGFRSARAAARAATVSPTTAVRSLDNLVQAGIVAKQQRRIVEGAAVDVAVFDIGPRWFDVIDVVRQVHLPERSTLLDAPKRIPRYLHHHFWNANAAALDVSAHESYIASRLIHSGDPEAISWVVNRLTPTAISSAAEERGLTDAARGQIRSLAHAAQARR